MRFVIDALGIAKPGGSRTSVISQLRSVFALDSENLYTVVVDSWEESLARFPNVEQYVFRIPNRLAAHALAQVVIPTVAHLRKAALVHHTKNLCAIFAPCPFIVTIHDMTTLRLPWTQSWIDVTYWKTIERVMARRARLVLTPSENAKRDICQYYGVQPYKVKVIPWAAASIYRSGGDTKADIAIRQRYGIHDRYVLFVGILALKKNLPTLVRAFRILKRSKGYSGKLVVVGREYPQSREKSVRGLASELELENDVVFTGPARDEDLPAIYRGADVFAFPSLHEGFGIVLLEAMACGVPVVTSDSSSLPEVAGDAALLVRDYTEESAWAEALHQALVDARLRSVMVERGLRRASDFSWEKVGQATLDSYLSVAQRSSVAKVVGDRAH